MLRKANQKRSLDDLVIQKGEFDWRTLFSDEAALTKALGEVEDREDARAAEVAAQEEVVMEGADEADFGGDGDAEGPSVQPADEGKVVVPVEPEDDRDVREQDGNDGGEDEGGTTVEYMISFVSRDYEFFRDWRL
jgi:helicase SWR1